MSFYDRVYEAVMTVPKGKVATYGQIAVMCGSPHASRAVGYALHRNPRPGVIPCHRIVNREGRLAPAFAFGGQEVQAELLMKEGVEVRDDFTVSNATAIAADSATYARVPLHPCPCRVVSDELDVSYAVVTRPLSMFLSHRQWSRYGADRGTKRDLPL